jgi:hypothetical protein
MDRVPDAASPRLLGPVSVKRLLIYFLQWLVVMKQSTCPRDNEVMEGEAD